MFRHPRGKRTYQIQTVGERSSGVRVQVRGGDVVGHAGVVIPRMLADATSLTGGLSVTLSRPEVPHDRGAVLCDVAVSIADGAHNLVGTAVLRDQNRLFTAAASVPTMWRSLGEIRPDGAATRTWATELAFRSGTGAAGDELAAFTGQRIVELDVLRQQPQWRAEIVGCHLNNIGVQGITLDRHPE